MFLELVRNVKASVLSTLSPTLAPNYQGFVAFLDYLRDLNLECQLYTSSIWIKSSLFYKVDEKALSFLHGHNTFTIVTYGYRFIIKFKQV